MFLAVLNGQAESLEPGERKAYLSISYEMDEYQCKEEALGKEVAGWRKNASVRTNLSEYECKFVHRKTRSCREAGSYRHEILMKIANERSLPSKAKILKKSLPGKPESSSPGNGDTDML